MHTFSLYRIICTLIGLLAAGAITTVTAPQAHAQTPTPRAPDCNIAFTLTAAAASNPYDNRQQGCTNWVITYTSSGFTVLSLAFQSSADTNGTPTSWGSFAGTVVTGINPNTAITQATSTFTGYYPWLRVNLSGLTGTGTVRGLAYGWKTQSAQVGGSPPTGAAGGCLSGTYPNPGIAGVTTSGGVLFANSTPCASQAAANLFWDNVAKRLDVVSNGPTTVKFTNSATAGITTDIRNSGISGTGIYSIVSGGGGGTNTAGFLQATGGATNWALQIPASGGNVTIGAAVNRNYKIQIAQSGSTGTESLVDTTATTGFTLVDIGWDGTNTSALTTRVRVRAGAAQSTTNLQEWQTNGGVNVANIGPTGGVQTVTQSVASLPTCVAGLAGSRRAVNDSLAPALGVLVAGGGAAFAAVVCNGATWTVNGI